jgi:hypothetical protein
MTPVYRVSVTLIVDREAVGYGDAEQVVRVHREHTSAMDTDAASKLLEELGDAAMEEAQGVLRGRMARETKADTKAQMERVQLPRTKGVDA